MAGGAEVYLHEIVSRLSKEHEVTLFCGAYKGCKERDEIDGVEIIRRGGSFTVYLQAMRSYLTVFRKGKYDIVVDSINGLPFFTPLFTRKPKVAIIHHLVRREIFFRELPLPLAPVGWLAERMIPFLYRGIPMVTVSESSRQELVDFGIREDRIRIIYNAIDRSHLGSGAKSDQPLVVYVGRIKQYKQIDHLVYAFDKVRQEVPEAELVIAGRGDYSEIQQLVAELGIASCVMLAGEVSEEEKAEILRKAWVFVIPSMKEGWGVSVIEANTCGTPAIAYNVPGMRDSIKNGETGILASPNNIVQLSTTVHRLLTDTELRASLSQNAMQWASAFSWDSSAALFEDLLQEVTGN